MRVHKNESIVGVLIYEAVMGKEITINQKCAGERLGEVDRVAVIEPLLARFGEWLTVSQELYDLLAQQNDRGMRARGYEW